jgi:hypothetical protein
VVFIETAFFTKQVEESLEDEDYGEFQRYLAEYPDAGSVVKGGAGVRKVRWALPGRGKSGGIRVMYYWRSQEDQIYLLYLFKKGERSDLTDSQRKALGKYVKEYLK